MTDTLPQYEVTALRYASLAERTAHQNFMLPDMHDGPMPLDFYVWAIQGNGRTIVVDTGFSPATGAKFSLLPPDNATGNFTKVVQRVPVKIRLSDRIDPATPLRPGMSATVRIRTHGGGAHA